MKVPSNALWSVKYYRTANGDSPISDFLDELPIKERAKVDKHLELLRRIGIKIGMPHARPLTGHNPLWELRPMPNRLIYAAFKDRQFIVLHAFTKKKNTTPTKEIKIAERRLAEIMERENG